MRNGTAVVALEDASQVGEVHRVAMRVAADVGLDESTRSDVGIVATEAATNVVRHAGRGEVLISHVENGLELVCLDHGPGLADVEASMRDGYSSAGSLGGGLGAMRRLADQFAIYSGVGIGTALVCLTQGSFTTADDVVRRARDVLDLVAAIPATVVPDHVDRSVDDLAARISRIESIGDAITFLQGLTDDDRERLARSDTPLAAFADVRTPEDATARFQALPPAQQMQLMALFMRAGG